MVIHAICPRHFFRGGESFSRGTKSLVTGLVTRGLGMQTSHCRLDWYMGMYWERRLVRFPLDILKSSLVGLDSSAWRFDWCLERLTNDVWAIERLPNSMQVLTRGDWKDRSHPSAVKINRKSFFEVAYANFGQTFFATVRG